MKLLTGLKSNYYGYFSCILIMLCSFAGRYVAAQDSHNGGSHSNHHKITGIMANSFIPNSFLPETDKILVVPTFGLNYDFIFHPKFGIGCHTDILLQQFKVEKHQDKQAIIRDNPIALCGMFVYKPWHQMCVVAGYGQEFEKHENLHMVRFGVEYEIPIRKNWELSFDLEYDYKFNTYGSLMFGVGFRKLLFSKNSHTH